MRERNGTLWKEKKRKRISRARAIPSKTGSREEGRSWELPHGKQPHHSSLGNSVTEASRALAKAQLAILCASRRVHERVEALGDEPLIMSS